MGLINCHFLPSIIIITFINEFLNFQIKMATIIANEGKLKIFDKDKIVTLSNFSLENVETFLPDLKLEQQSESGKIIWLDTLSF